MQPLLLLQQLLLLMLLLLPFLLELFFRLTLLLLLLLLLLLQLLRKLQKLLLQLLKLLHPLHLPILQPLELNVVLLPCRAPYTIGTTLPTLRRIINIHRISLLLWQLLRSFQCNISSFLLASVQAHSRVLLLLFRSYTSFLVVDHPTTI